MDTFQKLTPELLLNILFLSCPSFGDAVEFSHVSSTTYDLFQGSKARIIRHYFYENLGKGIVQDALAIICFPTICHDPTKKKEEWEEKLERIALIEAHLRKWGAKEFDLVIEPWSRAFEVDALIRHLWLYIEDYLAKARSSHLPRAYRRLPGWSHGDFSRTTTQISLNSEVNPFDIESLSQEERRLIVQAFLRYHLLCKIYGPIGGELDGHAKVNQKFQDYSPIDVLEEYGPTPESEFNGYRFDPEDPFRHWDWNLLYKYEDREPQTREIQLLPCVREYVLTVYGALIADQVPAEIPTAGAHPEFENAPKNSKCRFKDYDPDSEWECLHHLGGTGWSDVVISLLASSGFDLLTNILRSPVVEFRGLIVALSQETLWNPPPTDATNVWLPISAPSRRRRMNWHCNDFVRLYRQRAWALWDDSKQCPTLPTEREYQEIYGLGPVDGLVGWGLENDDTRNEFISHAAGEIFYPSLLGKGRPFWKLLSCGWNSRNGGRRVGMSLKGEDRQHFLGR